MRTKLKKWHIILMSCMALFIAVFASLFSLKADTVDDETGEIIKDNWEIGVVFYDSTVDAGKTPLTEINWDDSNGTYTPGPTRIITVQINYKNNSAVTAHAAKTLELSVPNLAYNTDLWNAKITLGANDSTHTGYAWTFKTANTPSSNHQNFVFTNTDEIESKTNFEGSIQIVYELTPVYDNRHINHDSQFEGFFEECTRAKNLSIKAILTDITESSEIFLNYTKTYIHPWQERTFTLDKTAQKVTSLDGFPSGDYYWVKYNFTITGKRDTSYPYIGSNLSIKDTFPSECIVLNNSLEQISGENNVYSLDFVSNAYSESTTRTSIIVGYPKSIYNDANGNLAITNHADLYANPITLTEYSFADDAEVSLNLADFEFIYSGNLYGISKIFSTSVSGGYIDIWYESLIGQDTQIGGGGKVFVSLNPTAIYTGKTMDVRWGDDLLYISTLNNEYRKLEDEEYCFKEISFPKIKNGNNLAITNGKYNCELWLRYAGQEEYSLYEEFTNGNGGTISSYYPNGTGRWSFTKEQEVVGYYFVVKNLNESLIVTHKYNTYNATVYINNAKNIPESGNIYNFAYVQVYIDGQLQNEPTIDSYANFITKEEIATFDQETYGTYMQRSYQYVSYQKFIFPSPRYAFPMRKQMSNPVQDAVNEKFTGKITISISGGNNYTQSDHVIETYGKDASDDKKLTGWEFFDLIPEGMTITDTPEEILNKMYVIKVSSGYDQFYKFWNKDGVRITNDELIQKIKNNTSIEFIHNWRNTNRTYVHIQVDLREDPIFFYSGRDLDVLKFSMNYEITYDSYLEYGGVYKNYLFGQYIGKDFASTKYNFDLQGNNDFNEIKDDGKLDPQTIDINDNGKTTDLIEYETATITITSVISTHQDVTKYVKSSESNFSTGTVNVLNNDEYQYKLRARTGNANVTNLILYDVLEAAQPDRTRWTGEFLGFDTSFAENKVYKLYKPDDPNADSNGYISYNVKINTYTSEDPDAGNLYLEDGSFNNKYKEYIEETTYVEGLEIKFSEDSKTEANYDSVQIYFNYEGKTYYLPALSGSQLAGKVVQIPSSDFYLRWRTDHMVCNYYGFLIDSITYKDIPFTEASTTSTTFSNVIEFEGDNYPNSNWDGNHPYGNYGNNVNQIMHYTYNGEKQIITQGTDKSKIKSIAFEYVNEDGTPAILPANSLTYVLINMKSPTDENITTFARNDCRTQWTALDDFDQPVDFITGINSNVVKVALPNSVEEDSNASISLRFIKEITGTDSQFENMKLNKADPQTFMIRLTSLIANDDGSYNQVTALLKSNQELIISQIPVGTYLLEELNDNYFDFVDFEENNGEDIIINGVIFERTDQGYVLTISEDLTENIEFNIKVTNEIEPFRPYEDKDNKENLFLKNKIEENLEIPS